LNDLDPARHEFIRGDAFDWLRRLAKKKRAFDAIVLDPPTFSKSKDSGVFQADKHFGKLVQAALAVLKPNGILFASSNAATWAPEDFHGAIESATATERRKILKRHFVPQPPDFPIGPREPGHLKTLWLQIA
jgi:23S rRNA (cytosine1962-C5)-methyltransferase